MVALPHRWDANKGLHVAVESLAALVDKARQQARAKQLFARDLWQVDSWQSITELAM